MGARKGFLLGGIQDLQFLPILLVAYLLARRSMLGVWHQLLKLLLLLLVLFGYMQSMHRRLPLYILRANRATTSSSLVPVM